MPPALRVRSKRAGGAATGRREKKESAATVSSGRLAEAVGEIGHRDSVF